MRQFDKIAVADEYRGTVRSTAEFTLRRHRPGDVYNLPDASLGTLDDLKALDAEVARILRPTAEQVHEYTMDNVFTGKYEGSEESPTGTFALVDWPNGERYLVQHRDGVSWFRCSTADRVSPPTREQLGAQYQALCDRFARWADIAEQEM